MTGSMTQLLRQAPTLERGGQALSWAQEKLGNIVRGDLMLGILSDEDLALIPQALAFAGRSGWPGAWPLLVQHQVDFGEAAAASRLLTEALPEHPELIVPLFRLQHSYLRSELPEAEQKETTRQLQQWCQIHPQDHTALYNLGLAFFTGFGVESSPEHSAALHAQAAGLGNADALFELYVLHSTGVGVELDEEKALQFLKQAAGQRQLRAMYNMGAMHATGRGGLEVNLSKATEWYDRAARAGHEKAVDTLIIMFLDGEGVEQDLDRAEEYIELGESFGYDMDVYREDLEEEREQVLEGRA
ncbi:sel1 repeat family protein [Deinococcus cavernae]|uniref:Sel1 repeat family protein n=2 Tax=Deinococcus cavernae TaxID=2320857 RepID=A0A418V626_9DEIO|nr:sel1 repeat family protein [Deinococcus cavernae]